MSVNVGERINTSQSTIGQDIIDWIKSDKTNKTEEEQKISGNLYHKYLIDREGNAKHKIYPNVYYYVNYNNKFNPEVYLAYIVRDKTKSPRKIPESLAQLDIVESLDSYKGSLIQEWAYFHNNSSESPFYMEACDIVTHFLEGVHPIRNQVYYHVSRTSKGVKVFRDLEKSPRPNEHPLED